MAEETLFGLPKTIEGGVRVRWATAADAEALIAFNVKMHADDFEDEPKIRCWVEDLIGGRHPTTTIEDFTIAERMSDGTIVSTLCTIPQTWGYEGLTFPVGRIELVGTLVEYRRRGLVRIQMDAVHAKGAARGELMQGITGIPWYYRKFGYEMGLDYWGGRFYIWDKPGNLRHLSDDQEPYSWRIARESDAPFMEQLYRIHCASSLIYTARSAAVWRHELIGHGEQSLEHRHRWVITDKAKGDVGYVQFRITEPLIIVSELAVVPGHSLRAVCLYLTRMFKGLAKLRAEKEPSKRPIINLLFRLGAEHPAYVAYGRQVERARRPYAWYVRIPEIRAFIKFIKPAIERRLAKSVMAGHTGALRINLYAGGQIKLVFEEGQLTDIGSYEAKAVSDGDAHYPDLLFVQQLTGRHSLFELNQIHADCYGSTEAEILINTIFPKQSSHVLGLG